jgi:hypothetical protein
MPISNELLSSTLFSIRDGEVDELFQRVPFLDFAKRLGGIEYEDGGIKIQRPLAVSEHSTITQLATGYEPVSLAVQDVMQPAIYEWSDFVAPIVITKKEELENAGEKAIVKIVEARMRNVMGLLRREINKQLVAANSTVLTSLGSLNGDAVSGATTGFLQQGAPTAAGQTNTVGGLARSLVPDGNGLFNRSFNCATSFSTNGIRGMQQLAAETSARAPMGEIKLVLATEAGYANYRRALFNQERYIDEKQLNAGYMSLAFGNAAVVQDVFMPIASATDTSLANTMYFINFDGIKLVMHSDGDLAVSPFEYIPGTTARSAQIYWKGQLIADNLASCAVLFDGETF